ncbi:AraC family transcriptional regulator [Capnocytophaga canimorsus]|uniref:GyrI-like domain-containing protein n=1 Tax=Capnocytophaga canimorsus TaxID=28188 RepID=UPI000D6E72AF|nr:GyrI-like domain-containing protein [Capnocytophaga canimorsus]AWL78623.1 AraC family transcriptional regulator [Capnocytophaga canimorsus]
MKNECKIIGIVVRTTNANGQAATDLGKLWRQFMSDTISKIPNTISEEIIAIYTDYESNHQGAYTAIIGKKVSSLDEIPKGMIGREFPATKFQKFIAKGEMPNAVMQTWKTIWEQDEVLNRAYQYDFEVYGEKSQNGDESEVEIFVSVK